MKRIFLLLILVLIFALSFTLVQADESVPATSAGAYVLYCPDSEQVLLSRNMNTKMGMASTTKIMTTLIALEYASENNKVVKFNPDMIAEGSSMYLKVGDKVHLSDLAVGMMTVSGNDAANAAAIAVGGSIEGFVELMNARAKEIGMKNTHFMNPSGLSDKDHYSTAYDMALLMTRALENEDFKELTAKKNVQVDFINPPGQRVTYTNHNKLLWRYPYCTGGKTGYTISDGRCLVTSAQKDNIHLVAVTLNDSQDWKDHTSLYEYGFSRYTAVIPFESQKVYNVRVASSEKESIRVAPKKNDILVLEKDDAKRVETSVYLLPVVFPPVKEGQTLGKVVCTLGSKVIYEGNLVSTESAGYLEISGFLSFFRSVFR